MRTYKKNFIATALFVSALAAASTAEEPVTQTWTDECHATMESLFKEIELVRQDQEGYRVATRSGHANDAAAKLKSIRATLDLMDTQAVQAKHQCGPREPMLRKVRGFVKDRRAWLRSRRKS